MLSRKQSLSIEQGKVQINSSQVDCGEIEMQFVFEMQERPYTSSRQYSAGLEENLGSFWDCKGLD